MFFISFSILYLTRRGKTRFFPVVNKYSVVSWNSRGEAKGMVILQNEKARAQTAHLFSRRSKSGLLCNKNKHEISNWSLWLKTIYNPSENEDGHFIFVICLNLVYFLTPHNFNIRQAWPLGSAFHVDAGNPNSGPCVYAANTSFTETFP